MIYYTQQDLAEALGVSRQVVQNWIKRDNGRLPKPDAETVKGLPLWSEKQVLKMTQPKKETITMIAKQVTEWELQEELNMTEDEVIELLQGLRDAEIDLMTVDNFKNYKDGDGVSFFTKHVAADYKIEYSVSYSRVKTNVETEAELEETKHYMKNEAEMTEEIVLVK